LLPANAFCIFLGGCCPSHLPTATYHNAEFYYTSKKKVWRTSHSHATQWIHTEFYYTSKKNVWRTSHLHD